MLVEPGITTPTTTTTTTTTTLKSPTKSIPFVDFTIDHDNLFEGSLAIIQQLFPTWDNREEIRLTQCKEGITNKLVKAQHQPSGQVVLIRAYGKGSELLIDRDAELKNLVVLSRLGLAPPVFGKFLNGLVYGFVPGSVLSVDDMADPKLSSLIAKTLSTWHSADVKTTTTTSSLPTPSAFKTIRKWISTIPSPYASSQHETQFRDFFKSREWLLNELDQLEKRLITLDSPIVFCHNDLLSANLIYNEGRDEVAFIDYEYGAYNYRGFDIGNHFCEWAGFDCDYSRYPDRETQLQWLSSYRPNATQQELELLSIEANAFALLAHFYWTTWALVQASVSDIDFDYLDYAKLRFSEYLRRKESFLP